MYKNYREARQSLESIMEIASPYEPEKLLGEDPKQAYLGWIKRWKTAYRALSHVIRELKAARKPYRYQYRERGDTTSKKRTQVGRNPNHDADASYYLPMFRAQAREMMEWREAARELSRKRKAERTEVAA